MWTWACLQSMGLMERGAGGGEEGFLAGILFLHPVIWTAAELARDAHSMMASTSVSARAL